MASEKHLMLTITHRGIDIIPHPDGGELNKPPIADWAPPDEFVSNNYWEGDKWNQYKGSPGKFSVKNGQKIVIHKDNATYLGTYEFAEWDRPEGLRYRCWRDKHISIDNPRDASGVYIKGVDSELIFNNEMFSSDKLEFTYTGKNPNYNMETRALENVYIFAFDLYLKKIGTAGYPDEGNYIWHGPVIRNDGGSNP